MQIKVALKDNLSPYIESQISVVVAFLFIYDKAEFIPGMIPNPLIALASDSSSTAIAFNTIVTFNYSVGATSRTNWVHTDCARLSIFRATKTTFIQGDLPLSGSEL
jgi:hypothetical protein